MTIAWWVMVLGALLILALLWKPIAVLLAIAAWLIYENWPWLAVIGIYLVCKAFYELAWLPHIEPYLKQLRQH